jgi:ribosome-associated protein YbcJ (S4-like RNA binding protein)
MMPELLDWVRTVNLGEFLKVLTWRKCAQRSGGEAKWDSYRRVEGLQCC